MAKPKRILCAIGSMDGGGSQQQMLALLRGLDRSRFLPLLYLVDSRGELLPSVPDDVPVIAFGDRHRYPRWNVPGRIHQMQVADCAAVIAEHEVHVVYDRTWFMTLITARASRRMRVPRISTVVSSPDQDLRMTAGKFLAIKRQLLARAYRSADQVVAVSEGLRESVISFYGLPPSHVVTLPNGIDISRVDELSTAACDLLPPDRFHIVTAGRLQEEKGYLDLVHAIDRLVHSEGRSQLLVHFLGSGRQREELESLVQSKRLEDYICFHGHVDNPFPFMRQAQLFCLTSRYEGMPNALLEAMACRVPALATDCPHGPREILAGGKYGQLIPPRDVPALARGIADVMDRPEKGLAAVEQARAHIQRAYGQAACLHRIEQLLDSCG